MTTAQKTGTPDKSRWVPIALLVLAVIWLATIVLSLTYFSQDARDLRQCDRAIRETLKAPATYRRISGESLFGSRLYRISYDAENSFGVPLRSSGQCSLMSGSASWGEGL